MTNFAKHMTNQQHPITPPWELVLQLQSQYGIADAIVLAYRAGADQELQECCAWTDEAEWTGAGSVLRRHRRPKPPSLNEDVPS